SRCCHRGLPFPYTTLFRSRTVELALEGFRYDDLRRWKTAEDELPTDVKGIKIVGTPWANPIVVEGQDRNPYSDAAWQNRTDADRSEEHTSELQSRENLVCS